MSSVFPRVIKSPPPRAVRSAGCYIYDDSGKAYFDGSGGAAVSCLGHGDAEVIAAVQEQLGNLAFAHTGFFTSEPAEELADLLIAHAPEGISKVYFVSGGSEATEAAMKLARQYFVEKGEGERRHIIARKQSYHGNTLGALAAGGNQFRRAQFEPLLTPMSHIAACYDYAERATGESLEDYGQRAANALEEEILRLGPETVIAFMAEPVVGATLGAVTAVPGYFKRIREICDRYGVLLILDEVMCGMGRTGHLFACEAEGVRPDVLCIAKGLGAGYQPIGAMLCSQQIYNTLEGGSGLFQHGHTYLGHPAACAAGRAVVSAILKRGLISRVREIGGLLRSALEEEFGQHPHVGDIRGRGLFLGLEFVTDRSSKTPFDPAKKLAGRLKTAAFAEGLVCYPMPGTRDGVHGDHVLLAPPFITSEDQVGEITEKLSRAVAQVI